MSRNGRPKAANREVADDAMDETDDDDAGDNYDFHSACLEEIDRYRRMDEWIPSYNNVLSITALDCKRKLVKASAADLNLADFLQYTRDGTSDDLRLKAFEALLDLGLIKQEKVLRWFLVVLGTDPSPYIRERMLRLFGKLLAALAIGEVSVSNAVLEVEDDGLTIEETSTEARKKEMDRTKTITGALEALKEEASSNEVLRKGLWAAVLSPAISLQEMGSLIDACSYLYKPKDSHIVKLRYPRYWKCKKIGKVRHINARLRSESLCSCHSANVWTSPHAGQAAFYAFVTHSP